MESGDGKTYAKHKSLLFLYNSNLKHYGDGFCWFPIQARETQMNNFPPAAIWVNISLTFMPTTRQH